MPELSSPEKARDHARSMGSIVVPNMPTIPAKNAVNLPPGVAASQVIWEETLGPGEYAARSLPRARVRLTNLEGDGCLQLLAYNALRPIERLNVADTVKVQWNAYLGKHKLLLSDMGRVLFSILEDTCQMHDTFCGASNVKTNAKKYGTGDNFSPHPNARDRFLLALQKFGLGKADIPPNINFFKHVKVQPNGSLTFIPNSSKPNDYLELRSELPTILVLANTPHVLDPRPQYIATPIRITAWLAPPTPESDPIRNSTPEALRAFQNTEDFLTQ